MSYSFIIPIYNEEITIPLLLKELKEYSSRNEILFINDGSTDRSFDLLSEASYWKLLNLEKNSGKGSAVKMGIQNSMYDKIIIFDGDLEIESSEIKKLMILNKSHNIDCIFGSRYKSINPFDSIWSLGTSFFSFI